MPMKKAKTKPIIAVDIDDVLFPTNRELMEFVNKHFGANLSWEDYQIHAPYWGYWERVWNVSTEEAYQRYKAFTTSDVMKSATTIDGAISVIDRLEKQFDLVIVTARKDEHADATHQWLNKHFPSTFKGVEFVPLWGGNTTITKADICNKIGASFLIDDNIEHCTLAGEAGINALLFGEYGWNHHEGDLPKNVTRVKTWHDVERILNEHTA